MSEFFTPAEIKSWFEYDPTTGLITWKRKPARNVRCGGVAGYERRIRHCAYISIGLLGVKLPAQVVAFVCMNGRYPNGIVDHVNGVGTDNKGANLRDVTHTANSRNQRRRIPSASPLMGVNQRPNGKWRARIMVDKREITLGSFDTKEQAVAARREAQRHHGFDDNHGSAQ